MPDDRQVIPRQDAGGAFQSEIGQCEGRRIDFACRGLLDWGLRYLLASNERIKLDIPTSAVNRSRRSSIIVSNNSHSRISRSIRARTASLPDKIKFIEISRTLLEIMLPEFCDKLDKRRQFFQPSEPNALRF